MSCLPFLGVSSLDLGRRYTSRPFFLPESLAGSLCGKLKGLEALSHILQEGACHI